VEKGDRFNLCAAPFGPFRQIGPVPFFHIGLDGKRLVASLVKMTVAHTFNCPGHIVWFEQKAAKSAERRSSCVRPDVQPASEICYNTS